MDDTFTLISRVHEQVRRFIAQELRQRGLSGIDSSHGNVIFSLMQCEELTMNELARKTDRTPQTITSLVKKLVDQGYVKTEKSREDSRVTTARLTPKGEQLAAVICEISERIYAIQYENITESEAEVLRTSLRHMYRNFQDALEGSD